MTVVDALLFLHVTALSLWCGWLFSYVAVVWPAILRDSDGRFPRALLCAIGVRTAPWISLAMATAIMTLAGLWFAGAAPLRHPGAALYATALVALVANNVYGSIVAWPRMMLLPRMSAAREWFWFRLRMTVALALVLLLNSVALVTA